MQFYGTRSVRNKPAAIHLALVCTLTISAHATTIIVSNTNDNGQGSLRQALEIANDGDTIDATGISGVITLTTGELRVNVRVMISGLAGEPAPPLFVSTIVTVTAPQLSLAVASVG